MTMRTGMITLNRYTACIILLSIVSCDSFKEDFIEPGNQVTFSQTEFYIVPGSSIIIDQKSLIKESFANVSLTVSSKPTRGQLLPLDAPLVKYKPGPGFSEGQDQFVFSVVSNGKVLKTQTVTIFMKTDTNEFPCGLYPVEDKVKVNGGSPVVIRVLANDRVCGTNGNHPQVSIFSPPAYGEAGLEGDSIIVYTPGSAFHGRDEILYKLTDIPGGTSSFGIITITEGAIQMLDIPGYGREILFMDERNGFLIVDGNSTDFDSPYGSYLYKTTDGGESWIKLTHPQELTFLLTDVFFLDADNGFLAANHGPLMHTVDGGKSWRFVDQRNPFGQNVEHSVFFTSSSTGFVSTSLPVSYDEDSSEHTIYKTEDGGKNWKEVFEVSAPFTASSILFPDPTTGYVFDDQKVYKTTDAGESWKLLFSHDGIFSPVATTDKHLYAILRVEMGLHVVHKSNDGLTWSSVETSQQFATRLAFSPSSDLGVVVGYRSFDEHPYELPGPANEALFRLSKTFDQGETWSPVDLEFYGLPVAVEVPSRNVVFILCSDKLLKYTP